jgi:hypothetical protein
LGLRGIVAQQRAQITGSQAKQQRQGQKSGDQSFHSIPPLKNITRERRVMSEQIN